MVQRIADLLYDLQVPRQERKRNLHGSAQGPPQNAPTVSQCY